jgi:hypothetical protein
MVAPWIKRRRAAVPAEAPPAAPKVAPVAPAAPKAAPVVVEESSAPELVAMPRRPRRRSAKSAKK